MVPPAAPLAASPAEPAPERLLAFSLEEILPQLSRKLASWPRTPEMVRYALHLIGTHADKETGLAVVHAKTFCRVTGRRHGHDILKELRALGYISCDGKYWAGKFSKRYRLMPLAKALPLTLIDASPSMSRRIRELRDERNAETLASLPGAKAIFDDLGRFSLPLDGQVEQMLAELRCERPAAEPYYRLGIDQLVRRHFFIGTCSTGRVFHNLASMPKVLRPFLRVDGAHCAEVDIAACQATLMICLYQGPGPERARYAEVIRAGFYEYLGREIELTTGTRLSRDTVKDRWLKQVFGLNKHRKEVWAILARDFPVLCREMDAVRSDDYREIAHRLQRLEAELVIGRIVPRIKSVYGNVGLSTVHDSLICPRALAEQVASITRAVLRDELGVEPMVRIKCKVD